MKTRRQLLGLFGAAAMTPPLASFAQQRKVWRIGMLWGDYLAQPNLDAFKVGLSTLGYAEGRDYVLEIRNAHSDLDRLPALAAELVALKVDLILPQGTPPTIAASKATREIPILITTTGDPVRMGFAASLARPGGNITGSTEIAVDLTSKRLDLLRQLAPQMRRVGYLYNPDNEVNVPLLKQFEVDSNKLKLQLLKVPLRKPDELATAFATLTRDKAQGLIVGGESTINALRTKIVELAMRHRLPAIYSYASFALAGGLITYGVDVAVLYRRAAIYADKLFKGAKPGDLPIQQPTTFEMVINLKTAKAQGLTVPQSILVQATRVIE